MRFVNVHQNFFCAALVFCRQITMLTICGIFGKPINVQKYSWKQFITKKHSIKTLSLSGILNLPNTFLKLIFMVKKNKHPNLEFFSHNIFSPTYLYQFIELSYYTSHYLLEWTEYNSVMEVDNELSISLLCGTILPYLWQFLEMSSHVINSVIFFMIQNKPLIC